MATSGQTVEAVYENGVFRPTTAQDLDLVEGQPVRIVVEPLAQPDAILALAAGVYAGLSDAAIDEVDKAIARRDDFSSSRQRIDLTVARPARTAILCQKKD